jgi:hypothetical protein
LSCAHKTLGVCGVIVIVCRRTTGLHGPDQGMADLCCQNIKCARWRRGAAAVEGQEVLRKSHDHGGMIRMIAVVSWPHHLTLGRDVFAPQP